MNYTRKYLPKPHNFPAQPIIKLVVKNAANDGFSQTEDFLIDSGADFIMIREQLYNSLNLKRKGELLVTSAHGKTKSQDFSFVTIEVPKFNVSKKLKALKSEATFNLLGRNFLNDFRILLDGLKLEYTIYA